MSQAGVIDIPLDVAINYVTNVGTAIASGGTLNIVGGSGITTSAVGNVITITNTGGSGTVTSVSGTANQVAVATGTTTPVISLVGPYTPSTYTTHGVLIGEGTSSITALGAGTAGQVLQSGGASSDPAYSTTTYPATNAINTLLYASSANVMSALATANNGVLLTSGTGVPSIGTATVAVGGTGDNSFTAYMPICGGTSTTGALQSVATGTQYYPLCYNTASSLPTFQLLPLAGGGTGAAITASNGGIFYSNATTGALLSGTATAGQLLLSGASTTPSWSTSTYPTTNAINTLLYASAANTMSALATVDGGTLVTSSSGLPEWLAAVASGSVLASAGTSTPPAWSSTITLTSVTFGSGSALSTYSTGTWTPAYGNTSSSPTVTYSSQVGRYTEIGSGVLVTGHMILTAYTAGSGNSEMTGLPFTSGNTSNEASTLNIQMQNITFPASTNGFSGRVAANTTTAIFDGQVSASSLSAVTAADGSATADVVCSGWYSTV